LVLGLGANFSCSAIYQATARVQITPPGKVVTGGLQAVANTNEAKQAVSIEMELLSIPTPHAGQAFPKKHGG